MRAAIYRAMRRATVFGLVGILVVGFGAYTAFWWVAAGKIELSGDGVAQAAHEKQIDVSWQEIRVGGYPVQLSASSSPTRW